MTYFYSHSKYEKAIAYRMRTSKFALMQPTWYLLTTESYSTSQEVMEKKKILRIMESFQTITEFFDTLAYF